MHIDASDKVHERFEMYLGHAPSCNLYAIEGDKYYLWISFKCARRG